MMLFENDTGYIKTEMITMVCPCGKENRGRRVEISEGNGSIGEKESRKTKENLERYSEEGFGTNRNG